MTMSLKFLRVAFYLSLYLMSRPTTSPAVEEMAWTILISVQTPATYTKADLHVNKIEN